MATPATQAEKAATAVIDWYSLTAMNHVTSLDNPRLQIEAHWFFANTQTGIPVHLFLTDAKLSAHHYRHAKLDPRCNCHGQTFGPLHPNGERYNIHEGNVEDILLEGFLPLTPADTLQADDVVVWLEPNRIAAHSARVETVTFVGGLLDWSKTILWTKNGVLLPELMSLADVASRYNASVAPSLALVQTIMEFWRPDPGT